MFTSSSVNIAMMYTDNVDKIKTIILILNTINSSTNIIIVRADKIEMIVFKKGE